ncbi:MAG: ABC transporter ATP-binding protein [bacterium]|nr:ABC transporter ATP-binding protein [bacterium]
MNNTVISLNKISKSFGDKVVLESIDLNVPQGTIIGLIGKNGAGKTTLIKCMLGLLKPNGGTSTIFGEDSWDMSNQVRHRIGYVPQNIVSMKWLKVRAMLDYTGAFYSNWDYKKVDSFLREWDLDPDAKINTLSEGEKQKLAIIMALGHDPDVLILDEPVASLDPASRRYFIKRLIELNINENKTMMFSTHIMSDLERIAADIILLKSGVIEYEGNLSDLKDNIRRIHFQSNTELPHAIPVKNVIHSHINKTTATFTVNGMNEEEIQQIGRDIAAFVTVEQLNLEEIFLELNK